MRSLRWLAVVAASSLSACTCSGSRDPSPAVRDASQETAAQAGTTLHPESVPTEGPSAEEPPTLAVDVSPSGTVRVRARDRWGQPVDTTFENATFLSRALPTLERALTPGQMTQLRAELAKLPAPAGP